jgi:hypothetical protein
MIPPWSWSGAWLFWYLTQARGMKYYQARGMKYYQAQAWHQAQAS